MPKRKTARRPAKRRTAKPKKRTVKRAAKRVVKRRPTKKRVAKRKVSKRRTTRAVSKPKRLVSPARKTIATRALKAAAQKIIGKTVHYYDRIGVAIVELKAPLTVGDAVTFKRGDQEHTQMISSMQIEHAPVVKARKGDVVGIKVTQQIHEGAEVLPA